MTDQNAEYVFVWNPNNRFRATAHRSDCPVLKRVSRGRIIPYANGRPDSGAPPCGVCRPMQNDSPGTES
jgi:hypothetical protein